MPTSWKVMMAVLIVCLLASMVIGVVRLTGTPDYGFSPPDQGWRGVQLPR
jgi:hypothetical protein